MRLVGVRPVVLDWGVRLPPRIHVGMSQLSAGEHPLDQVEAEVAHDTRSFGANELGASASRAHRDQRLRRYAGHFGCFLGRNAL